MAIQPQDTRVINCIDYILETYIKNDADHRQKYRQNFKHQQYAQQIVAKHFK